VGKELFTAAGPQLVEALVSKGFDIFLDLKFHDIPNTVAKACEAASKLGVWMLNVHASGGLAMMQAARNAIEVSEHQPLLIAVTVLTSMDEPALNQIGVNAKVEDQVMRLAKLTQQAGLDGVVCSAQEAATLRQALGSQFCLVTPGIRPADAKADDQSRITTPAEAVRLGANYLVIGRPITQAVDPLQALQKIHEQID
jgi:orotidine-5'-phosphate decarboxylase